MRRRSTSFLSTLVLTSAALGAAHAAELGDARVSSYIGQPLSADIELAMIDDPSAPVAVRLASREVYNGAGIAMPPVLSGLNLAVVRRGGRQFLHATSSRPVESEHVHLYLELTDKGQRAVRLVTLWLTPDPNPTPPPAPAPGPVVAAAAAVGVGAAVAPAPVLAAAPIRAPASVAAAHAVPAGVPALAPASAPVSAPVSTTASAPASALAPASIASPASLRAVRRTVAEHGDAAPAASRTVARPASPAPQHAGAAPQRTGAAPAVAKTFQLPAAHGNGPAASCVPASGEAQACTALGAKNAALREQLGKLEEKVKGLQVALGVTPAAGAPAASTLDKSTMAAAHAASASATAAKADPHAAAEDKAAPPAADVHAPAGEKAASPAAEPHAPAAGKDAAAPDAQAAGHGDAPQAQPEAPPVPAGPKPISAIKPLVPHKPKAPPPSGEEDGLPWAWIAAGAAVLAAAGGSAVMLGRRRKNAGKAADKAAAKEAGKEAGKTAGDTAAGAPAPAAPGLLGKLKQRFASRTRTGAAQPTDTPGAVPKVVEPTLE